MCEMMLCSIVVSSLFLHCGLHQSGWAKHLGCGALALVKMQDTSTALTPLVEFELVRFWRNAQRVSWQFQVSTRISTASKHGDQNCFMMFLIPLFQQGYSPSSDTGRLSGATFWHRCLCGVSPGKEVLLWWANKPIWSHDSMLRR